MPLIHETFSFFEDHAIPLTRLLIWKCLHLGFHPKKTLEVFLGPLGGIERFYAVK